MTKQCAVTNLGKISYKFDIVFAIVFAAFSIFGGFYLQHLEYEGGLANEIMRSFFPWLFYIAIGVLLLVFNTILCLIRIFLSHWVIKCILIRIAFALFPFVVFLGNLWLRGPVAPIFLKGFEKRVIKEVDINAIQRWLVIEEQQYKHQCYIHDFPSEFPICLTVLKPDYIRFEDSELDSTIYIEIGWGGMSQWGLRIGPPYMNMPEDDFLQMNGYSEYRRFVAPGAYVFIGG